MTEEIRSFWDKIRPLLEERMEGDTKISLHEVVKNNGRKLTGICFEQEENRIRPTVYLEDYLERYRDGESLVKLAETIYRCAFQPLPDFDIQEFMNWDRAKLRVCMKLVNREKNKELLADVPHVPFLDLELLFYYILPEEAHIQKASILIHNSHCNSWGITTEELHRYAKENTLHLNSPHIKNMIDVLDSMGCVIDDEDKRNVPMWVMTSQDKYYGAIGLFYADIIREFARERGKSLFVLPSSIHELIIVEDTGDESADMLRDMVCQVNATQLSEDEILSDSVYRFDLKSNQVTVAAQAA